MSFADRAQGGLGSESDENLLRRTAAGDQPAFRELARRHAARALAVAQRIVGNAGDAEEVAQDALLRIWQHAPSWRPAEARVTTRASTASRLSWASTSLDRARNLS